MGLDGFRALLRVRALPREARRIVFFAEGPGDWAHLGPLAESVAASAPILCLTCSREDPILRAARPNVTALCVGDGLGMALLMRTLDAKVCVMTMPDLQSYHVKRSIEPVHYVYVFHCLFSTHMIYRDRAFDAYDTLFCSGPHHAAEIRARERRMGLRPKRLVEHGYGRLDRILASRLGRPPAGSPRRVLVAPTWGPASLAESDALDRLLEALLGAGWAVTLRLHPMTLRRRPETARRLAARFGPRGLGMGSDMEETASLALADAMVTDWSGASLDFLLGFERPVLFVDTPPKVNNPAYAELGLEPVEMSLRRELGATVPLERLDSVPDRLEGLLAGGGEGLAKTARALRDRLVYNRGASGEVGSREILALAGLG